MNRTEAEVIKDLVVEEVKIILPGASVVITGGFIRCVIHRKKYELCIVCVCGKRNLDINISYPYTWGLVSESAANLGAC